SPEQHVVYASSLAALTVPAADHGAIEIPHTFSFPEYDPGRFYRLTLEADTDGDGQYEELASIPVFNVIPATEQGIAIKQDPDGGIIIVWPDPCDVLEVNPNFADPAGWTTAPVQTSPYRIRPTGNDMKFFRLRP